MQVKKMFVDSQLENGKKVRLRILPAISEGIPLAKRILSLVAPTAGSAIDGLQHDEFLHGAPQSFTNAASVLCSQLDKAEVTQMIAQLLNGLEVDGERVDHDTYFGANYGELVEVVTISIKENFSSFFTSKGTLLHLKKAFQQLLSGAILSPSEGQ